jgi:predicted Zn-dependent protease
LIRVPTGDGMLLVFFDDPQEQTHSPSPGLAITYLKMGRMADARRILDQLIEKSREQYVSADSSAEIYAALGDKDGACEQLAAAIRFPGPLSYGQLNLLPFWDPLRGDPRFETIVASLAPKE